MGPSPKSQVSRTKDDFEIPYRLSMRQLLFSARTGFAPFLAPGLNAVWFLQVNVHGGGHLIARQGCMPAHQNSLSTNTGSFGSSFLCKECTSPYCVHSTVDRRTLVLCICTLAWNLCKAVMVNIHAQQVRYSTYYVCNLVKSFCGPKRGPEYPFQ